MACCCSLCALHYTTSVDVENNGRSRPCQHSQRAEGRRRSTLGVAYAQCGNNEQRNKCLFGRPVRIGSVGVPRFLFESRTFGDMKFEICTTCTSYTNCQPSTSIFCPRGRDHAVVLPRRRFNSQPLNHPFRNDRRTYSKSGRESGPTTGLYSFRHQSTEMFCHFRTVCEQQKLCCT